MNLFRGLGDGVHSLALVWLLTSILVRKSAQGISGKDNNKEQRKTDPPPPPFSSRPIPGAVLDGVPESLLGRLDQLCLRIQHADEDLVHVRVRTQCRTHPHRLQVIIRQGPGSDQVTDLYYNISVHM